MNENNPQPNLEQRLIALEERMTHAERLFKELNEVVCSMQDRLDRQERAISQLTGVLGQHGGHDPENRTLEDDRPPHY